MWQLSKYIPTQTHKGKTEVISDLENKLSSKCRHDTEAKVEPEAEMNVLLLWCFRQMVCKNYMQKGSQEISIKTQ